MFKTNHAKSWLTAGLSAVLFLPSCERAGTSSSTPRPTEAALAAAGSGGGLREKNESSEVVDLSALTNDPITAESSVSFPLMAAGKPAPAEDEELAAALAAHRLSALSGDFSALEDFLGKHPSGTRSHAVRINLAGLYYSRGEFTKSYAMWQDAWNSAKELDSALGRRLAGDSFAGLSRLMILLGRREDLKPLLESVKDRPLYVAAAELRLQAAEALESMDRWQQQAFKCGPFALFRIRHQLGLPEPLHPLIEQEESTIKGTNMAQLADLGGRMGMPLEVVRLSPEDKIPVPSVVHWKLGHYSAITSVDVNGDYVVEDTTFAKPLHMKADVLRAESSGYYLAQAGKDSSPDSLVSTDIAKNIWGRMSPPGSDPDDLGDEDCDPCRGMAGWTVGKLNTNLRIVDTPMFHDAAVGPDLDFTIVYNARDSSQSSLPNYPNLGPGWTFNLLQFILDDPAQALGNVRRQRRSGGLEFYRNFDSQTGRYALQSRSSTLLEKAGSASYTLTAEDGSREVFGLSDGVVSGSRRIFLTKRVDPAGNELVFHYDASRRLVKLVDATGKETHISYSYPYDPYRITAVTDPYGRTASFQYDDNGRLATSTDTIGIKSHLFYDAAGQLVRLKTPDGETKFDAQNVGSSRQLTITNAMGHRSRYKAVTWEPAVPGLPDGLTSQEDVNPALAVSTTGYSTRMTYHWGEKAMHFHEGDYSKADQYFWLQSPVSSYVGTEVLKAVRRPFVNMTFFQYPEQTSSTLAGTLDKPIATATKLPDGQVRIDRAEYNTLGLPTKSTDPLGRETLLEYDPSGRLAVKAMQKKGAGYETLYEITSYNAALQPLQVKDAAGMVTTYTYNARGQITTVVDPAGEIVTSTYQENPSLPGYARPLSVVSNHGASTTFTYDSFDRPATSTDQDGHTLAYEYDGFNRLTKTTYSDGTNERYEYRNLDLVKQYDREGKPTEFSYNPLGRLQSTRDSLNRLTQYEWCLCGALQKLTDPAGNETHWEWNIIGQNLSKTYPDGRKFTYAYDSAGRLGTSLDPKGQTTSLTYNKDDTVAAVNYDNAVIATSPVAYTYDPDYARLQSWTDSLGTTTYAYNPADGTTPGAGSLANVDGPWADDTVTSLYDAQNRAAGYTLPGGGESWSYDSAGRIATSTSVMGTVAYTYQGASSRVLSAIPTLPSGGPRTFLTYGMAAEDFRLKEITHKAADGSVLAGHSYGFTRDEKISHWHREFGGAGTPAAEDFSFRYDGANRLLEGTRKNTATGAVLADHQFLYDRADNRVSLREGNSLRSGVHNAANQLVSQAGGGKVRITGSVNKAGAGVTLAGQPAAVHPQGGFAAEVDATPGANRFPLVVTEANGTVTTKYVELTFDQPTPEILTYDANGNLASVAPQATPTAPTRSYQWDAANRLVGVTRHIAANEERKTEFLYNGMGERIGKRELLNGTVESDVRYLYGTTGVLQERGADGGTVTKTYTSQGVRDIGSGTNHYHTADHLGNVREVWDESGGLLARYDYKPYGERVLVSGTDVSAKGFTGHDYHAGSGLLLTRYRAYNPATARWLSPDPLGEEGGLNLYAYVEGDPVNWADSLGLAKIKPRPNNPYTTADEGLALMEEAGILGRSKDVGNLVKQGRKLFPKKCPKPDEWHHIIPKYIGGAKDGLMAKIPAPYHQLITNEFRRIAPYGTGPRSAAEIGRIIERVYRKYPIAPFL